MNATMVCPKCGAESEASAFCPVCGAYAGAPVAPPVQEESSAVTPAAAPAPVPPTPPSPIPSQPVPPAWGGYSQPSYPVYPQNTGYYGGYANYTPAQPAYVPPAYPAYQPVYPPAPPKEKRLSTAATVWAIIHLCFNSIGLFAVLFSSILIPIFNNYFVEFPETYLLALGLSFLASLLAVIGYSLVLTARKAGIFILFTGFLCVVGSNVLTLLSVNGILTGLSGDGFYNYGGSALFDEFFSNFIRSTEILYPVSIGFSTLLAFIWPFIMLLLMRKTWDKLK